MLARDDPVDNSWMQTRIRELREARGWSLDELASRSEISLHQLSRIELGANTTINTLARIAAALGVTLATLVTADDEELPETAEGRRILAELGEPDRTRAIQILRAFLPPSRIK